MQDLEILDYSGDRVAIVDDFTTAQWKRSHSGNNSFKVEMSPHARGSQHMQKERVIVMPDGIEAFIIEQLEYSDSVDDDTQDKVTITGRSAGMMGERLCLPAAGLAHDARTGPAETVMKGYVTANAGSGAAAARQVPGLVVAADQGRGAPVTVQARYNPLEEILKRIANDSGVGWEVSRQGADFVFEVVVGVDRTDTVYFDQDFDTVLGQKFLSTVIGRKTFAYVAGQGTGAARTLVERYAGAAEPTGLARREVFIDARDISTNEALEQRGDAKLEETKQEDIFQVEYNQYGSFIYRDHWDLGDIVMARNADWSIEAPVRIVEVESTYGAGGLTIKVGLGKAWPTIKDIVKQQADLLQGTSYE